MLRGIGSAFMQLAAGRMEDIASQMDTKYLKKDEILFFKELIAAIVKKGDGCLDHNEAIRLGQKGGMRVDDCDNFMDRMVQECWLQFRFVSFPLAFVGRGFTPSRQEELWAQLEQGRHPRRAGALGFAPIRGGCASRRDALRVGTGSTAQHLPTPYST